MLLRLETKGEYNTTLDDEAPVLTVYLKPFACVSLTESSKVEITEEDPKG